MRQLELGRGAGHADRHSLTPATTFIALLQLTSFLFSLLGVGFLIVSEFFFGQPPCAAPLGARCLRFYVFRPLPQWATICLPFGTPGKMRFARYSNATNFASLRDSGYYRHAKFFEQGDVVPLPVRWRY